MVLISSTETFAKEKIRIASGEWLPYQSEKLKYHGVASRIVTEAFALSGIQVEYGYFPWARSLNYAKLGKWDGTFLWFDTTERRNFFYISEPVVNIQYVFFHLKNYAFDWKTIDNLKDIYIGATIGYKYGEKFENAEKMGKIYVDRIKSDNLNFRKLLKGNIHIFPCDLNAGYEIIQKNFTPKQIERFTYHPRPIKAAPHHLLLSKKIKRNNRLLLLFNQGLKQLKDSGKVEQYFEESRRGEYNL